MTSKVNQRFVSSYVSGYRQTFCVPSYVENPLDLIAYLASVQGCLREDVLLECEGKVLSSDHDLPQKSTIIATLRLPGGKGGFGSMLRAIGAQIEKTTNKEACRDLSGRRLRDINKEKLIKEQLQKRAERDRERLAARKKKFESLNEEPKHFFDDSSFHKEQEEISQALFNSIDKGLKLAAAQHNAEAAKVVNQPGCSGSSSDCSSGTDDASSIKPCAKRALSEAASAAVTKKKKRFHNDLDDTDSDDSD